MLVLIPAPGYRLLGRNPVFCLWAAYVITRPLGASIADGLAKPRSVGGLGLGDGPVALGLLALTVAYVAVTNVVHRSRTGRAGDKLAPLLSSSTVV